MKIKLTRTVVAITLILVFICQIFLTYWLFSDDTKFWKDYFVDHYGDNIIKFGWFHLAINTLDVIALITMLFLLIYEFASSYDDRPFKFLYRYQQKNSPDSNEEQKININWKKYLKYGILLIVVLYGIKIGKSVYHDNIFLYNTSKKYHNTYTQKVQEKQGFYDKLWKTYLQKEKITNINKETFILVTKIIMENRKDGENLTWKWLQENQQIPYSEFTIFYKDLSYFIESQRAEYFNIEKICQTIANQNNTLLDTFPNNLYNRILKLEKINFEYGFLSDSTINVFTTKKENID